MSLIDHIDQYKRLEGIKTDIELAAYWGISADYISKIRRGIRQPGNRIWRAIVNDAPSLTPHMLLYFQSLNLDTRKELSDFNAMKDSSRIKG